MSSRKQQYTIAILASLGLGLAPFVPEPHLFGKLRWLLGGGTGMQAMNWFDLLMHGAPFGYLMWLLGSDTRKSFKNRTQSNSKSA